MARDALTVTSLVKEGVAPIAQTLGVAANDLEIASGWDERLFIEVENMDSSARTVTIESSITVDGLAVVDLDVSIPAPVKAAYTTVLAGANNDIVVTARVGGIEGNSIKIEYLVAGNNTALTVSVAGRRITVNVATDGGGAATSTADLVKAAIEASAAATALVTVADSGGDDGTGIVTALAVQSLTGGVSGKKLLGPFTRLATFTQTDGTLYIDLVNDSVLYFRAYTLP